MILARYILRLSACTRHAGSRQSTRSSSRRVVFVNRSDQSHELPNNRVSNTKFTPITFLPRMLSEQFSAPMQLYFLLIASLQLWRAITPVNPVTSWAPLILVFSITCIKEAMDDMRRAKADAIANSRPYTLWRTGRTIVDGPAQDIRVGDLVRVNDDDEVPCDLLLLKTAEVVPEGVAFVETSNLDGETDLKTRAARPETSLLSEIDLLALRGRFECEPPNADLYRLDAKLTLWRSRSFDSSGSMDVDSQASSGSEGTLSELSISGEQLLQHGTVLRKSGWVIGLAVYTGSDTKLSQNKALPPTKVSIADKRINRIVVAIFSAQVLIIIVLALLGTFAGSNGNAAYWYLGWPSPYSSSSSLSSAAIPQKNSIKEALSKSWGSSSDSFALSKTSSSFSSSSSSLTSSLSSSLSSFSSSSSSRSSSSSSSSSIVSSSHQISVDPTLNTWTDSPSSGQQQYDSSSSSSGSYSAWVLPLRFLLLSSMMIPISLKVSLDLAKVWAAFLVSADIELYDASSDTPATAATANVGDDLGCLSTVLTDKTGTLTENVMALRAVSIGGTVFGRPEINDDPSSSSSSPRFDGHLDDPALKRALSESRVRELDFFRALALCNIVKPEHVNAMPLSLVEERWALVRRGQRHSSLGIKFVAEREGAPSGFLSGLPSNSPRPGSVQNARSLRAYQASSASVAGVAGGSTSSSSSANGGGGGAVSSPEPLQLQLRRRCVQYASSSPDEEALAFAAARRGIALTHRRDTPGGSQRVTLTYDSDLIGTHSPTQRVSFASPSSPLPNNNGSSSSSFNNTSNTNVNGYGPTSPEAVSHLSPSKQGLGERGSNRGGGGGGIDSSSSSPFFGEYDDGDPTAKRVWVSDACVQATYDVLHILPFTSDRKRMSVIVRKVDGGLKSPNASSSSSSSDSLSRSESKQQLSQAASSNVGIESGELYLICKGADEMVRERLSNSNDPSELTQTIRHLESFASLGLRTLIVGGRPLSQREYEQWKPLWDSALAEVGQRREAAVSTACEAMEHSLKLFGATAVEDKLQDGVPATIAAMRKAGLGVWMLTGDKLSTALQIARAANLIGDLSSSSSPSMILTICGVNLCDVNAEMALASRSIDDAAVGRGGGGGRSLSTFGSLSSPSQLSSQHYQQAGDVALVVEGHALRHVLSDQRQATVFAQLALRCGAVICCRCTPAQKAALVSCVRAQGKVTLAIGDGGNDVAMIQAANVGVGISGREGLQAARASDYAVARFRHLERLILFHGRNSLYRASLLARYTIYKSMAVAFTQLMANALCSFSGGSLLDTYSLTTYNLLYTALPGLALALDQDRRAEQVLRTPSLYSESASLQWLSTPLFLSWCLRAAYQAFSVLFILAGFALFPSGARDGSTLDVSAADAAVFSALILVQLITVATEMSFPTPYNHLINSGCLLLHVSIMLIRNVWSGIGDSAMGTVSASSPMFPLTVLLAAVVATVPFIAERAWRMNSAEAMRASLSPTHAPREYSSREQDRDSDSLLSPFQSPEPPGSASKTMRTSNSLSRMV